jgi:hypothetical protein
MSPCVATEAGPSPTAFVASTVNVYPVPFVSPVTVYEGGDPTAELATVTGVPDAPGVGVIV